jgi:ABC-type amino acid transport system permease subunit
MYLTAAALYWLLSSVLAALQNHMEKRANLYSR